MFITVGTKLYHKRPYVLYMLTDCKQDKDLCFLANVTSDLC